MGDAKLARVLQDFITTTDGELSLQKGDIVQILKQIDKLWCYGACNGKYGNMPLNFLIVITPPSLRDGEELFVSIANFKAQQTGDLSFPKGELIVGLWRVDDNWWEGDIDGRRGVFPTTYTWQLDSSTIKKNSTTNIQAEQAYVKKSMTAQLEDEMDLFEGEILTITEIIDKDWYRGKCNGRSGIFPASYVTLMNTTETFTLGDSLSGTSEVSLLDAPLPRSSTASKYDALPTYEEIFDSNFSIDCANKNTILDDLSVLDDDYFKQNAPSTLFRQENVYDESSAMCSKNQSTVIVPYGISLYPFRAQFDNELSFEEGEIVTLIRYVGIDWMEGKVHDKKGIFPSSYVNIIVDCGQDGAMTSDERSALENSDDLETESFAVVLYNYDAQMDSDLSVKAGEVVYIVEQPNNSWCRVRNQLSNIGLCPRNYLALHGASKKEKTTQFQRFSLANDRLLSESEQSSSIGNIFPQQPRSYQHQDFQFVPKSKMSVDDLISMNIDDLKFPSSWQPRLDSNNSEIQHGRAVPVIENSGKDSVVEREQTEILEFRELRPKDDFRERVQEPFLKTDRPQLLPSRYAPLVPACNSQATDRMPHRPAPPVPLPGQKPVRWVEPGSSKASDGHHRSLITTKECQLKILQEGRENILQKVNLDSTAAENTEINHKVNAYDEKIKILSDDLRRLKGECSKEGNGDQACSLSVSAPGCSSVAAAGRGMQNMDQRQNTISELVMTEKEYVRDLKLTYETFNLHDSSKLEDRDINVKVLFGNISDVMLFAETFLDKLLLSMKGKDEEEQCIGIVFLDMAEEMKSVYGQYCMNHDEALALLEKYESDESIQKIFNKGLETLRYQIACFDMGSILIKPVQRILKYPLILNELIKCTDVSHKDRCDLVQAVKTITDVATYINECKRRKDIVSKYLVDGNTTISTKMARLSLHSVAKKSARLGMLVSSTFGFGAVNKDPAFNDCENAFHTIEKIIRTFLKNVETFVQHIHEVVLSQCYIAEGFAHFYQEKHSDVEEFAKIQKMINFQYFREFESTVQRRVAGPLNILLELLKGPAILIQKRHDKFLDYNACVAKAEKNKDIKLVQEEMTIAKNNYLALNDQLLEELPTLLTASSELFVECLSAFVTARKLFTGKAMKQYLTVLEKSKTMSSSADTLEACSVRFNLVLNQLCRLNFVSLKKPQTNSPKPKLKQRMSEEVSQVHRLSLEVREQTSSQRAYLQHRYDQSLLYQVTQPCTQNEPLELNLRPGHLIAVIKKQNPMGDSNIWFVDDGASQGFANSRNLKRAYPSSVEMRHSFPLTERVQAAKTASGIVDLCQNSSQSQDTLPPPYQSVTQDSSLRHLYEEVPEDNLTGDTETTEHDGPAEEIYYAMYDFQGNGVETLSIRRGQMVKILQKHDSRNNPQWWYAEDHTGNKGFVPRDYVGTRN